MNLFPVQKNIKGEVFSLCTDLSHDFFADCVDIWDSKKWNRLVYVWKIIIFNNVLQCLHEFHILHTNYDIVHWCQIQDNNKSSQLRNSCNLIIILISQDFQKTLHASICHKNVSEIWRIGHVRKKYRNLLRNVDVIMGKQVK